MINDRIFLGFPIKFKDICEIFPPKVNDVVGNERFNVYLSLFTITQEELDEIYLKDESVKRVPTPFQYLMMNYYSEEGMRDYIEEAFKLFVHEPVTIVPEIEMLLIGKSEDELDPDVDLENPRLITEDNFSDFQNKIRLSVGQRQIEITEVKEEEEA